MSELPYESELNRLRESFKLQLDRHSRGEMSETERVAFEREQSRMWESFHLEVDRYCRGQMSETERAAFEPLLGKLRENAALALQRFNEILDMPPLPPDDPDAGAIAEVKRKVRVFILMSKYSFARLHPPPPTAALARPLIWIS
jgi:hypothetical protein